MASADLSANTDQDSIATSQSDCKEYDAFISYNSADEDFANDLVKHLESPVIGLKCVNHKRDFHPGRTIVGNINEFLENSSKYVLIMSPDFVRSDWCQWETEIMVSMSVEEKRCIIPVLLKPCKIPKTLSTLTYVDVCHSDKWRERLVNSIKRTDLKGKKHKTLQMKDIQKAAEKEDEYKNCVQRYNQNREIFDLEKKALERKIRNAYDTVSKQILDALELQKLQKLDEILRLRDKRLTSLVQRMNAADGILKLMNGLNEDDQCISKLDKLQDEYDLQEQKLKQLTYVEFVVSDSLMDTLTEQISKFDVGHLRETDTTLLDSSDDLSNTMKDIRPSFDTLSGMARLDLGEDIGRPDMKFDEETVHICRAILHDGSLLNREPSGPVTNSDKRLKKFFGAVATPALTTGGVYYWESKVDVDLKKELSSRNFLFAVALSTNGVFDEPQVGHRLPTVVSVAARACERHEAVCLYVNKYGCLVYHEILTLNQSGNWLPIELGFLLDTIRQRLAIYDVTKKGEITCVDEIGDVEEFTPQFGVYAGHAGSVRLSLTRGQNTSLSMGKQ
ncbi:uncharacterized protein [Haliotis asinina]|uniref:uncharacterized protein n=1 Tax=Haliotis asinina TaxID=109174 RepID=UPI0035327E8A